MNEGQITKKENKSNKKLGYITAIIILSVIIVGLVTFIVWNNKLFFEEKPNKQPEIKEKKKNDNKDEVKVVPPVLDPNYGIEENQVEDYDNSSLGKYAYDPIVNAALNSIYVEGICNDNIDEDLYKGLNVNDLSNDQKAKMLFNYVTTDYQIDYSCGFDQAYTKIPLAKFENALFKDNSFLEEYKTNNDTPRIQNFVPFDQSNGLGKYNYAYLDGYYYITKFGCGCEGMYDTLDKKIINIQKTNTSLIIKMAVFQLKPNENMYEENDKGGFDVYNLFDDSNIVFKDYDGRSELDYSKINTYTFNFEIENGQAYFLSSTMNPVD